MTDFPNAAELAAVPDDTLLEFVRNGGLHDQDVRAELHRRNPDLEWIDHLRTRSYRHDSDQAGGHPNPMRLQLSPESSETRALCDAYDAALAAVLGDPSKLAERRTISLADWSELAGVAPRTLTGYVARGQAPGRCRFDAQTGRPVWDEAVARAWVRFRVGRGSRRRA